MTLIDMTPDAAAALDRAGFSRRSFLKGSGALIVGFSMAGVAGRLGLEAPVEAQAPADRRNQLDAWIAVAADGTIVAYTGKCELGQGLFTVQTQLVAEELQVPLERVRLIQCDTGVDARSGHDVRRTVASGELQQGRCRAGGSHRAAGAPQARLGASQRSCGTADGARRHGQRDGRRVEASELRRSRGRPDVPGGARPRGAPDAIRANGRSWASRSRGSTFRRS